MGKHIAGKHWVVRTSGRKATYLHREPSRNDSSTSAVGMLRNGQLLVGEFMHVRRASRETGYVKVRHMEPMCGSTWQVRNSDGSPKTLLRKQPLEARDAGNAVCYASEGEQLESEFLFVCRVNEKKGGFVRWKHIKAAKSPSESASTEVIDVSAASLASSAGGGRGAAASRPQKLKGQEWSVLDSEHDGAWLRRVPRSDLGKQNVIGFVHNGETVVGELVHVRRRDGQEGAMKLHDLEQLAAKAWRIRSSGGFPRTTLWKDPALPMDAANTKDQVLEGEQVEGGFVFVIRKDGKNSGYMKRKYLAALA